MNSTRLLDDVAAVNLPRQFGLLEKAVDVISGSETVHSLHVRGSLATGTADRLSDLDFIVAVHDPSFGPFIRVIDTLMSAELGAILPGWRDTIVARMGGLGYVSWSLTKASCTRLTCTRYRSAVWTRCSRKRRRCRSTSLTVSTPNGTAKWTG